MEPGHCDGPVRVEGSWHVLSQRWVWATGMGKGVLAIPEGRDDFALSSDPDARRPSDFWLQS